jgi:hypothetical protein
MTSYQPGEAFQGTPTTHPRAVPSLVCGIVGLLICGFLAGIPAIILGNQAIRGIDASNGSYTGRGIARAGVILGWLAIAWTIIAAILVAISRS